MQTINTIIVDDEPLALTLLSAKLKQFPQINILAQCSNGRQALEQITSLFPDLIFLDIEMPGLNGLEVIKKVQTDIMPLVIFTTAFEQYALDAFNVNAVDYILKPIDEQYIHRAVERASSRLVNINEENHEKSKILAAIQSINAVEDKKVVIKDGNEITLVEQSQIEWIDAAGDYCCIHSKGLTHIKRCTIASMLDELDPQYFKRIHRSTIVNLNYINKVTPLSKGEYFLHLNEFEKVKVSRTYKETIKAFLSK